MKTAKITKAVIGTFVIGSAAAYLLYQAVVSSWVYYYPVDEFVSSAQGRTAQNRDAALKQNRIIRLAGRVKPGTITINAEKMQLDFELTGRRSSLPVKYHGVVPRNFEADKEVVVEGRLSADGVFQVDKILTRCEAKYRVKL